MDTVLNSIGYGIRKSTLSKEEYRRLKKELTVIPLQSASESSFVQPTPVLCYRERVERFYTPKYYGIQHYGFPKKNYETEGTLISVSFNGALFDHQKPVIQSILDCLLKEDACIASLGTGFGKTVSALWIVSQLKVKTAVVVCASYLMDQWNDQIKKFLPTASIGRIQAQEYRVGDITMFMMHSLCYKDYDLSKFREYGLVIIDEMHHVSAQLFSQSLFKLHPKRVLGLSATPRRKDGTEVIFPWFFNRIITASTTETVKPSINFFDVTLVEPPTPEFTKAGKLNIPKLITTIGENEERNKQLVDLLYPLIKQNRKILVFSDRIAHVERMYELLNHSDKSLRIGALSIEELEKSKEKQVIFSTYGMSQEGFDCKGIDTIIMTTPRSDVEQIIGRIMGERVKHCKNPPLVYDIKDHWCPVFRAQFYKRYTLYKKKGWISGGQNDEPLTDFAFLDDDQS